MDSCILKRHLKSPVCRREYRNSQSPTPDRIAVGDVPQYILFPCGLCKTAHFPGRWISRAQANAYRASKTLLNVQRAFWWQRVGQALRIVQVLTVF
jgi:hypothetical protein